MLNIKKILSLFFALSLVLNLMLGIAMVQNNNLPTAEAFKEIKTPGTYGPPAMEIIDDDATISTADVTLQNTLITGNLYLTTDINEGTITLIQVEVQGEVIIAAGSKITLLLLDSSLAKITVQKSSGAVAIIAKGSTSVASVDVAGEASLQEDGSNETALGFQNVKINTDKKVILLGDFNTINIDAKASVKVIKGSVAFINIYSSAANTELDLAKHVQIESLSLYARMTLTGEGNVNIVDINVPGLMELQGTFGEVSTQAGGIFLELQAGSINKLLVPQLEASTSIALAAETMIYILELNGPTAVTGKGQLDAVTINQSGVTLEQTPTVIVIAEGLVAMIGGEEYKKEPEPEPEPEPKPEPTKPTVNINSISNMTLISGNTGTRDIVVSPSGAGLSVSSSNNNIATVSISGKKVTVTAKNSGTVTITVKGNLSGYTSGTKTFKVTVKALTDVKEFKTNDGLSPGKTFVFVTLYDPNPSKYVGKVKISGVVLEYLADFKQFYGEVNSSDAKAGNVRVE